MARSIAVSVPASITARAVVESGVDVAAVMLVVDYECWSAVIGGAARRGEWGSPGTEVWYAAGGYGLIGRG